MIEEMWRDLLGSGGAGDPVVASHEVEDVIALMIEARIDPQKFAGNLLALASGRRQLGVDVFREEEAALPTTPSVSQYISRMDRPPLMPVWVLAGFPDVIAWVNETHRASRGSSPSCGEEPVSMDTLFGIDLEAEDLREEDYRNPDGSLRAQCYRNLIRSYLERTGHALEAAVEDGSAGDVYLGRNLLQTLGEESNFTLIASMTSKYYMELKRGYSRSFPDETSLLAMSGILDASAYILGTGEIEPRQISELAKATQGESDRLQAFIVKLEALLLSVDTPEVPPGEVLEACREQADAIEKSIRNVVAGYQREPLIERGVQAAMTLPKFSHLRRAAGVRDPSLLTRVKRWILH